MGSSFRAKGDRGFGELHVCLLQRRRLGREFVERDPGPCCDGPDTLAGQSCNQHRVGPARIDRATALDEKGAQPHRLR